MVTDRMITLLENGVAPWKMPWKAGAYSFKTGQPYSFLNQLMLIDPDTEAEDMEKAMQSIEGAWLTFKQINELGGKVKKGAKSRPIMFWKKYTKTTETEDGESIENVYMTLKYYNVFHIRDTEGIEETARPEPTAGEWAGLEFAGSVVAEYILGKGIGFNNDGREAYYSPTKDMIVVPSKEKHDTLSSYYSTVFHEMVHSTGHPARLNRLTPTTIFGSEVYSKEELVAELGAAFLCGITGCNTIKTERNNAAYLQGWLNALQNDKKMVVKAASKAQQAVEYILENERKAIEYVMGNE